MLKSLSIRNMGSNRRVDITLDPFITCITGESYTGKSWILRALKLIALNQPSSTRYIKWGTNKAVIMARVGKHTITRERSKTVNRYFIDERIIEAFGNKVPSQVSQLFNLTKINFQIQQELPSGEGPLFWFALTPGQVSKRLNQIVNLDLIDKILHNLQSAAHSAKVASDICRERKKEAQQRVGQLSFVKRMRQDWLNLCQIIKRLDQSNTQLTVLEDLLSQIEQQRAIVKKVKQNTATLEEEVQELEQLRDTIIDLEGQVERVSENLSNIDSRKFDLLEAKKTLETAERSFKQSFGKRCPLCLQQTQRS